MGRPSKKKVSQNTNGRFGSTSDHRRSSIVDRRSSTVEKQKAGERQLQILAEDKGPAGNSILDTARDKYFGERRAAPIIEAAVYGLVDEIEDNDWRESELADGRARFDPDFVRFVSEAECEKQIKANRAQGREWYHHHDYGAYAYRVNKLVPRGDDQPVVVKFYNYCNHVRMRGLQLLLFATRLTVTHFFVALCGSFCVSSRIWHIATHTSACSILMYMNQNSAKSASII